MQKCTRDLQRPLPTNSLLQVVPWLVLDHISPSFIQLNLEKTWMESPCLHSSWAPALSSSGNPHDEPHKLKVVSVIPYCTICYYAVELATES